MLLQREILQLRNQALSLNHSNLTLKHSLYQLEQQNISLNNNKHQLDQTLESIIIQLQSLQPACTPASPLPPIQSPTVALARTKPQPRLSSILQGQINNLSFISEGLSTDHEESISETIPHQPLASTSRLPSLSPQSLETTLKPIPSPPIATLSTMRRGLNHSETGREGERKRTARRASGIIKTSYEQVPPPLPAQTNQEESREETENVSPNKELMIPKNAISVLPTLSEEEENRVVEVVVTGVKGAIGTGAERAVKGGRKSLVNSMQSRTSLPTSSTTLFPLSTARQLEPPRKTRTVEEEDGDNVLGETQTKVLVRGKKRELWIKKRILFDTSSEEDEGEEMQAPLLVQGEGEVEKEMREREREKEREKEVRPRRISTISRRGREILLPLSQQEEQREMEMEIQLQEESMTEHDPESSRPLPPPPPPASARRVSTSTPSSLVTNSSTARRRGTRQLDARNLLPIILPTPLSPTSHSTPSTSQRTSPPPSKCTKPSPRS